MKMKNATAGFLGLTTAILHANLYDTEEKLKERYGEPVEVEVRKHETKQTYNWREYTITVEIANFWVYKGETIFQSTRRLDGKPMTLTEIASLLKRDYFSGDWQSSGGDKWHIGNHAVAEYDRMNRTLIEKLRRR